MPKPPEQAKDPLSGVPSIGVRIWDTTQKVFTLSYQLHQLEREDVRLQSQVQELARMVMALASSVSEMVGQMKVIEKRLEDRDKLAEATIALRIREEMDKVREQIRSEMRGNDPTLTDLPEESCRIGYDEVSSKTWVREASPVIAGALLGLGVGTLIADALPPPAYASPPAYYAPQPYSYTPPPLYYAPPGPGYAGY